MTLPALTRARHKAQTLQAASAETLLRSFSTADAVLSKEWIVTNGGWQADCAKPQTLRLFEVANPDVEQCTLLYRARLRTEGLQGRAYLEMWCRVPGYPESFSRGLDNAVSGTTDWAACQTPFFLKKGQKPDLVRLNLVVEGTGRLWVSNAALARLPLR